MLADLQHPGYPYVYCPLESVGVFSILLSPILFLSLRLRRFYETWLEVKFKSIMEHFASRCIFVVY